MIVKNSCTHVYCVAVLLWLVLNIACNILVCLLVDSYVMKRAEDVAQLSAMLAATTSLVHQDLNDIDEAQQLAGQQLVTNLDQLLDHCSQTQVCAVAAVYLFYVELLFTTLAS